MKISNRKYQKLKIEVKGPKFYGGLIVNGQKLAALDLAGFTLLELLLYMTLVAMMVMTLTPAALDAIQGEAKVVTAAEVYSQARYVSERLKYEVRNATAINTGTSNFDVNLATDTSKQLSLTSPTNGTTLIKVNATGQVTITQGVNPVVVLMSNDTKVTSLVFTDYTSSDNKSKHVGFVFTLTDNSTSVRQEYAESVSVRGSAEVRSN